MRVNVNRSKTRIAAFGICLALVMQGSLFSSYARPSWPSDTGIEGDAGIVVDMDTGAVLFGQNIHQTYAPASITKLLTALVTVENVGSLDEMVTFSHDAVYNVESGSGNPISIEEGDQLSVRDCLYALLLRSSNQAGNALAEHVAREAGVEGGRDGFVAMMNQKIQALGCKESHFANPSGLNDEEQYVSAYDMALIGCAAFQNEEILEIERALSHDLPPTYHNPQGLTVYQEHKMLITSDSSRAEYYPAAVAGKTGFTSIALNTLVTCAEDNGRRLVAVILKSNKTHYSDTINLLNFGFQNFQNLDASGDERSLFGEDGTLTIGDRAYRREELEVTGSHLVTVPLEATLADVDRQLVTGEAMAPGHPEDAVAELCYSYDDRVIGRCYLRALSGGGLADVGTAEAPDTGSLSDAEDMEGGGQPGGSPSGGSGFGLAGLFDTLKGNGGPLPVIGAIALGAAVLILCIALPLRIRQVRRKREEMEAQRRARRRQRLAQIGYTEEEFQKVVEERYGRGR